MGSVIGVKSFGIWTPETWQSKDGPLYTGVELVSNEAPWRELLRQLEAVDADPLPHHVMAEADAIFAIFWRYGSYAALLCEGTSGAAFRQNLDLYRITDDEMKRITIEFSAGIAEWFTMRREEPERCAKIVNAAHAHLDMPWANDNNGCFEPDIYGFSPDDRSYVRVDFKDLDRARDLPPSTDRQFANWLVRMFYRDGPVEVLHAGDDVDDEQMLGARRLFQADIVRIGEEFCEWMELEILRQQDTTAEDWELFRRLSIDVFPSQWSETDETSDVSYASETPGAIMARMEVLSKKFPETYSVEGLKR